MWYTCHEKYVAVRVPVGVQIPRATLPTTPWELVTGQSRGPACLIVWTETVVGHADLR